MFSINNKDNKNRVMIEVTEIHIRSSNHPQTEEVLDSASLTFKRSCLQDTHNNNRDEEESKEDDLRPETGFKRPITGRIGERRNPDDLLKINHLPTDAARMAAYNRLRMVIKAMRKTNTTEQLPTSGTNVKEKRPQSSVLRRVVTKMREKIRKKKTVRTSQKLDTCMICEDGFTPGKLYSISGCAHQYCEGCSTAYLTYKINAFEPILCPEEACKAPLDKQSQAFKSLPVELKRKRQKYEKFQEVNKNPNLRQCNTADCQGNFDISMPDAVCMDCGAKYCKKCLYVAHEGECSSFQVEFLQNNYKYRQCNGCKAVVEKNQGCNHITCKCGYQFCYLCGVEWSQDPCRQGLPPGIAVPPLPNYTPDDDGACCQQCCDSFTCCESLCDTLSDRECGCESICVIFTTLLVFIFWLAIGILLFIIGPILCFTVLLLVSLLSGPLEAVQSMCQLIQNQILATLTVVICLPFVVIFGAAKFFWDNKGQAIQAFQDMARGFCDTNFREMWDD